MTTKREVPTVSTKEELENNLSSFLDKSQKIALLLDFDGTLAPIVEHPEDAKMPKQTEDALRSLANNSKVFIAIISGRGLSDVKDKAGLANITYAGNHGIEIENSDGTRSDYELPAHIRESYKRIVEELRTTVAIHGAWVEDKRASLTFHFRKAPREYVEQLKNEATKIIQSHGWIANSAHCAVEGKPPIDWNKGEAAKYILKKNFGDNWDKSVKAIFIGDDTTDEDAMKALQGVGKTFRISPDPKINTYADYRLPSTDATALVLDCIEKFYS